MAVAPRRRPTAPASARAPHRRCATRIRTTERKPCWDMRIPRSRASARRCGH
ncbi:hypothetical protein GLE_5444 [Lysobacter enzymogenes]|uniref:Uncharacterized protein n=1 Tax=Lysobacter enzymogenes TaxID=69 RepID=A0A0S2DQP1_LYSEN|nr:hypothetical protein GLE_5444 [Lysobacter enzymogenes]